MSYSQLEGVFPHMRAGSWSKLFLMVMTALLYSSVGHPASGNAATGTTTAPLMGEEADKVLQNLAVQAAKVNSLASPFTQETHIPMFAAPVLSYGRFAFIRPGTLLWEYTEPFREGFALQEEQGLRWEGEAAPERFSSASDPMTSLIVRQMISWVSLDMDWIRSQYDIAVLQATPPTLRLTPKAEDTAAVIAWLEMTFTDQGMASSVLLQEAQGGRTVIRFTAPAVNTLPPLSLEELTDGRELF